MITAFVIQVEIGAPKGFQFVSSNGKLSPVPKFFLSKPTVRHYLSRRGKTAGYYDSSFHDKTQIVTITGVEQGLRGSTAAIDSAVVWLENAGAPNVRMLSNPKSYYKIKRADGTILGGGLHGHIFNRAGDVRRWATNQGPHNLHRLEGYEVVEIELAPNKIDVSAIRYYPFMDFYRASPASRRNILPYSPLKRVA